MRKMFIIHHSYQGVSEKMAESLTEGVEEGFGETSPIRADRALERCKELGKKLSDQPANSV